MKKFLVRKVADAITTGNGAFNHGTILTMTHDDLDISVSLVDFIFKTTRTVFIKPSGEVVGDRKFKKIVEKALEII